jgi:hypothetical protein
VPDYYGRVKDSDATDATADVVAGKLKLSALLGKASKTFRYDTGGGTLDLEGDANISPNGDKITLKVNGNVHIIGAGIRYDSAGTVVGNIPQFNLLVNGNIYVDPSVGWLDGFYDAQGTNGRFVTCANATGPIIDVTAITKCNTHLQINGSIAATDILFIRPLGDREGKFSQLQNPAETVQFSPQFWLPSVTTSGAGPWQSVTSLPPIL